MSFSCFSQECDLNYEDFTETSNTNPPEGWVLGNGASIGSSFPVDPTQDPAMGFNSVGEYTLSNELPCMGTICFDWHSSSINSLHQVEVSIGQGDMNTGTNWIALDTIVTPGSGNTPNTYQNVCFTIPVDSLNPPFGARLKLEMIQSTNGTFYFENVCFNTGTCNVNPSQFSFTSISNSCKEIGTSFGLTVCATDDSGFIDSSYTEVISLAINSGSGVLSGDLSEIPTLGCVNFLVSISDAGTFDLIANSSSNSLVGISPIVEVVDICPLEEMVKIMSYNLLNYPNGRDDCGPNTVLQSRWDTLAKITSYVMPDVLMVCELQDIAGSDSILNRALNINGISNYMKANFVVNQSTSSTLFNNMFYYNADKLTLHSQEEILTGTRDFNKYTVFVNDPGLGVNSDTIFIDFYMAHLKAGSTLADRNRRALDCQILREYLDARPERNSVLAGDLNLYTDNEDAYEILTSGVHPFDDPADKEGNWEGNETFATVCTQSSRGGGDPSYDCGFGGGNDSRFDFILTSTEIRDSVDNVFVVEDSYEVLGNNGSIFNRPINDPSNTSMIPDSVLNSLYYMSDHLPVLLDLKITFTEYVDSCTLVYNLNESGEGSLRFAIDCAEDGDIIRFSPDVFGQEIVITNDELVIDKDIEILARPGEDITISSVVPQVSTIETIFIITANSSVVLDGFTLNGGYGPNGSAIVNEGTLTLENMTISKNGSLTVNSVVLNKVGGVLINKGNTVIE